jgi:hypothetical protein
VIIVRKLFFGILAAITAVSVFSFSNADIKASQEDDTICYDTEYTNETTGYSAYIFDEADILTTDEEDDLLEVMKPITEHSDIIFDSTEYDEYDDYEEYARQFMYSVSGKGNDTTVFVVNLADRKLTVWSDGNALNTISNDYGTTITDNVYKYAHNKEYYKCAAEVYNEINSLWNGQKIKTPMKIICNVLIAIVLSLMFNVIMMLHMSSSKKASDKALLNNIAKEF